jgi:hypothetical protein
MVRYLGAVVVTTAMRKHLAEIQAIAGDVEAALNRGELPTIFDANILEFRAQALAVLIRNAFVASLVGHERTPEEDRASQRYIETGRDAEGVAVLLDDTEPLHSGLRDNRQPENAVGDLALWNQAFERTG